MNIPIIILDSSESPAIFVTNNTKYMVVLPSFPSSEQDLLAIDTPKGEDLILGFDFHNNLNPYIDLRKGLITFNPDHKNYHDPSKSLSNDFPSADTCAALVGDSRTLFGCILQGKTENLPPHYACGHHIKMEQSLPSVGVIYSLSN
ncbi:hypothetical protein O181_031068 [Austropuccinia psidii MF-1]|uniref:Uncharacterized protein n=1 Tax=Austropuccinia psidii MF-1 TaxID=1389203 RepID=A0A9Q3CYW6_9BASI|nr:hypothetical protein [Austropuccinia psidii MF-1]